MFIVGCGCSLSYQDDTLFLRVERSLKFLILNIDFLECLCGPHCQERKTNVHVIKREAKGSFSFFENEIIEKLCWSEIVSYVCTPQGLKIYPCIDSNEKYECTIQLLLRCNTVC